MTEAQAFGPNDSDPSGTISGSPESADGPLLGSLGMRIRAQRKARGLSVEALSAASDVSTGLISMIERGKANPSFSTLVALARGLDVSLAWLFNDGQRASPVVRKSERRAAKGPSPTGSQAIRELLTPDSGGVMEALWLDFPPGQPPGQRHHHEGEDFLFVVSGRLDVYLGDAHYELDAGDSIRFTGPEPHTYGNLSEERCTAVFVSVPVPIPQHAQP